MGAPIFTLAKSLYFGKVSAMATHHRFLDVAEFVAETAAFFAAIAWTLSLLWIAP